MKFNKQIILIAVATILMSCGGAANGDQDANQDATGKTDSADANYEGMVKVNLSDYNVPAEIYIPGEKEGKATINETSWGSVEITVGDNFGIEIVPFGMSKEDKKTELDGDMVYQTEYIKETDNMIIYKSSIKDSEVAPEMRFFIQKTVGDDTFEIKSMNDKAFNKRAVDVMVKSANSLTALPIS